MKIVGYEVVETRIPESLDSGSVKWFVFRLIVAFFYGVTFMPVTMVYLAIMSVIELFVDLPEDVCDFADKMPKILSVIFVIVLVIKFLSHL